MSTDRQIICVCASVHQLHGGGIASGYVHSVCMRDPLIETRLPLFTGCM